MAPTPPAIEGEAGETAYLRCQKGLVSVADQFVHLQNVDVGPSQITYWSLLKTGQAGRD